jgi:hypothetical protein
LLTIFFHLINQSRNITYFCIGFGFSGAFRATELKENPVLHEELHENSGAVPAAVSPLRSFLNSLPLFNLLPGK